MLGFKNSLRARLQNDFSLSEDRKSILCLRLLAINESPKIILPQVWGQRTECGQSLGQFAQCSTISNTTSTTPTLLATNCRLFYSFLHHFLLINYCYYARKTKLATNFTCNISLLLLCVILLFLLLAQSWGQIALLLLSEILLLLLLVLCVQSQGQIAPCSHFLGSHESVQLPEVASQLWAQTDTMSTIPIIMNIIIRTFNVEFHDLTGSDVPL